MPKPSFDTFKDSLVIKTKTDEKHGQPSKEHDAFLRHCRDLIATSRKEMCKHYSTWDYHDAIFRSRRIIDKEDRNANAKNQPAKMIVPLTFGQIMTFVAFNVQSVTQNKRFYQLEPTGTEDNPLAEPLERILERDLRKNTWLSFLTQHFLDIGRFCLGAAEVCYHEEYRNIRIPQTEASVGAFGVETTTATNAFQKIPVFVGNKLYPLSPYRIFPDCGRGLPLTRFQEGEFCGSEDMFSISTLRSDSAALFNLKEIPKYSAKEYSDRRNQSRVDEMDFMPDRRQNGESELRDPEAMVKTGQVVVTKVVLDIVPRDFECDGQHPLGDEDFPIRYIVWYANDKTIIRFEEAYYLHGQFPYIIAQFLPDQHRIVNEGLSDVCDQITNTITWLINAAITSKRSSLDGKFIVDPAGIDIKSLESRSPYIFLRKNASQTGIDRYIKQFQTVDTTATYMQDAAQLKELLEQVSGYNGQMQGQTTPGRRSATSDRVTAQGASARGKTVLGSIWDSSFEPLGKQLIANNRQEMDFETFSRIVGDSLPDNTTAQPIPDPMTGMPAFPKYTIEELYTLFAADPITIATAEDFFVYDGTQPAEKAFLAQSLQEIFMAVVSSPEVAAVMGWGPAQMKELFNQIYLLRGVTPAILPPSLPAPMPPQNVLPGPGAASAAGGPPQPTASVV